MKYKQAHISNPCWAVLTHHAVEQYISRWAPHKDVPTATNDLICLLNTAKKQGKTNRGDQIYVSGHQPEIRMVIKDHNVCITVLPFQEIEDIDFFHQQEIEIYKSKEGADLLRVSVLEKLIEDINQQIVDINALKVPLHQRKGELCAELDKLKKKIKYDL